MSLFNKAHYTWLAEFAGKHLTVNQQIALMDSLAADNPRFDRKKFAHALAVLAPLGPDSETGKSPFIKLRDPALRREEVGGKEKDHDSI